MSRTLIVAKLREIKLSDSRPTTPETVNALAESMRASGLINPIIVKPAVVFDGSIMVQGHKVVAGNHRVSAARALGWEGIDAFVVDGDDDLTAELVEIDENLCRAELTAAQRSAAIKRRKEIWTALHPNTDQSLASIPCGRGQPEGFAAETAKVSGQSKSSINQHVARAEALGDDLVGVVGTSLDKGVELDALAKLPEPERKELIDRAKAGEKVTARGEGDRERNIRLARQAVAELDRCAKYMDDEEFVEALDGIHVSLAARRIAEVIVDSVAA